MTNGNGGVQFTTKEMFEHIEARLQEINLLITNQASTQNTEVRDVRHRVANLEAMGQLTDIKFRKIEEDLVEIRTDIAGFKSETRGANKELTAALKPMHDFLAGQASIDRWKKGFYTMAGLLLTAIGLLGGWIWAN